jgi:hypothetical protein
VLSSHVSPLIPDSPSVDIKKKCLPLYGGEAYQMFSQRNNPYCDLLSNYGQK